MKGKVFSSCTCNPVLVVVVIIIIIIIIIIWMCMDIIYICIYIYIAYLRIYIEGFRVCRTSFSICVWQQLYYDGMDGSRKEEGLAFILFLFFRIYFEGLYIMHTHWFVRKEKKTLLFLFLKRVAGFGLLIDLTRVLLMVNLTTRQQQQEKKSSR